MKKRILKQHFRRDGKPKLTYESREEAKAAMVKYHDPRDYSPYICRLCLKWHYGSTLKMGNVRF